jgi:hypothetical protein
MPQILRTTLIQDEPQTADGVLNFDLPVNPISVILLTIKATNDTEEPSAYSALEALLSMVPDIRVAYRGANVIQGSATDLAVLYGALTGWQPEQSNQTEADGEVRAVTIPLSFGRRPYDPAECFPATRRGDLIMSLTTDVAVPGADNLILQAETVELLDAAPQRFIKATTTSRIFNATGDYDLELPIGNDLLGVLLRSPVVPSGASYDSHMGRVRLQVDNVETAYSEANWETLHGELIRRMWAWAHRPHVHGVTVTGTVTTLGTVMTATGTTRQQQQDFAILDNYAYLDLDPLMDGQYALKTAGAARVNLRITAEAPSPTAARAIPVELVSLPAATQAAGA